MGFKDHDYLLSLGARLAIARSEIGLSQARLAAELDVSLRAYQSYEKGSRGIPVEALAKLNRVFKVDLNWVLLGVGSARVEHDLAALEGFEVELDQYLVRNKITVRSEKRGAIVSKWYGSMLDGKAVEMSDVYTWIELLKE